MRFKSLAIQNFRAIREFAIENLTDFILIAGPNGCGKSCVLDAIRLIKSVYGGYIQNEWQRWFGEFNISLTDRNELYSLMRDRDVPLVVSAEVQLSVDEKQYIDRNLEDLLIALVWNEFVPAGRDSSNLNPVAMATQYRQHAAEVNRTVVERAASIRASLPDDSYPLSVTISRLEGGIRIGSSPIMELVFQTYRPERIGVIDYHSASRAYQREGVGGVDLDIRAADEQRRSYSLYNWASKYQNVKTELARMYFRDLVRKEAGLSAGEDSDLNAVMAEMFQIFFPDKEYLGVRPDSQGSLSFPVRLRTGEEHDLNELSSGEKEVVYGYLRMRSSAARNSMLLLDEPELHLNPGLLHGVSDFYHRHLGRARNNQLWLVTHSDTLLRQAVGNTNYSILHMTSATSVTEGNQAVPVLADDAFDAALIDLVGDLAMYQPRGKVVIFEGGGDTDFDVDLTSRLFPDFAKKVNLVSGGNKRRVRDLYEVLSETAVSVGVAKRFYAIVDKDTDVHQASESAASLLTWNVYHIENYLLEPEFVRLATNSLIGRNRLSDNDVLDLLEGCARDIVPRLRIEFLRKQVNAALVRSINLGASPHGGSAAAALLPSVKATHERLREVGEDLCEVEKLEEIDKGNAITFENALLDGRWRQEFPGRAVLKRYAETQLKGLSSYEGLRNLIIERMVDSDHRPPGMQSVIESILKD